MRKLIQAPDLKGKKEPINVGELTSALNTLSKLIEQMGAAKEEFAEDLSSVRLEIKNLFASLQLIKSEHLTQLNQAVETLENQITATGKDLTLEQINLSEEVRQTLIGAQESFVTRHGELSARIEELKLADQSVSFKDSINILKQNIKELQKDIKWILEEIDRLAEEVKKVWKGSMAYTGGAGVTDHGALGGLLDDDHTQYTANADTDVSGNSWVLDEDDMASDDATKVPTQQSVKAYVDTYGGALDTTGTITALDIPRFSDEDTLEGLSYDEFKAALDLQIGTDMLAVIGAATDNAIVRVDGATGLAVQGSGITIDDSDGVIIPTATGIDYNPGSDINADIITVGVTGASRIYWDEAANRFHSNVGFTIDGYSHLDAGARFGATSLFGDNILITFGTDGDAYVRYQTYDADAKHILFFIDESADPGNNVPVFAFMEHTGATTLTGLFDAFVQPLVCVVDNDKDSWFGITFSADDVPYLVAGGASGDITTNLKLDNLAAPDDNTDLDFSTSLHGLVPKGTNVGNFLKDDGTWAAPAGGGDMLAATYDPAAKAEQVLTIGDLENPPTEDLATKAPTSEWAFDHNARDATAAQQGHATAAQITKLDGIEALADVTDADNVNTAGAVMEADFNAHTILAATVDNTPAALEVTEQTVVGRITSGNIAALSVAQLQTLISSAALPEGTAIIIDDALSADGKYCVTLAMNGIAGEEVDFGEVVYFKTDSKWWLAKGDAEATISPMTGLVITAGTTSAEDPIKVAIMGEVRADAAFPAFTVGAPVFISAATAGILTTTELTTGQYQKAVGWARTANSVVLTGNPDWVKVG